MAASRTPPPPPRPTEGGLSVIALVSGGKDSFFSILHCQANGHRVVALANLHPGTLPGSGPVPGLGSDAAGVGATVPVTVTVTGAGAGPDAGGASSSSSSSTAAAALPAATVDRAPAVIPATAGTAPELTSDIATRDGGESLLGQRQAAGEGHGDHDPSVESAGGHDYDDGGQDEQQDEDEHDLNSFMYQTVGHQVIPLYADATGIPLYRRAIVGGAGHHGKDYYSHRAPSSSKVSADVIENRASGAASPSSDTKAEPEVRGADDDDDGDETESMVPLLRAIMAAHPEANAICAGAILSTYQRTRVESVATHLGLVPLAYLWKFPTLPTPESSGASDAQLLDDMAAVGLEARIVKVASGGLDDSFLWTNVVSAGGRDKIARSMRRFGMAEGGAIIGEGGEFETIVLDGPARLFRKRIVVAEADRRLVMEGGGTAWLNLRHAKLEAKDEKTLADENNNEVRIPDLLDPRFISVLDTLSTVERIIETDVALSRDLARSSLESHLSETLPEPVPDLGTLQCPADAKLQQWCFVGNASTGGASVEVETASLVEQIHHRLQQATLAPSAIINATILLRRMADFPTINTIYGALFDAPNPPARVTISCGRLLSPADGNIAVYLTVHTGGLGPGQRQGLHVQSRSYWAPANIGPYSQAVAVPLRSLLTSKPPVVGGAATADGPQLVSIAGQIPLVPATMALPTTNGDGDGDALKLQLTLSLQHLWRIGLEMGVQWWTSGVAYFPACGGGDGSDGEKTVMAGRARMAARAWEASHRWSAGSEGEDDDDEDEDGPDLWDRTFDRRYMSYAGAAGREKEGGQELPDWEVVVGGKERGAVRLPRLFVAEVAELPRAAMVEWHAHLGIAKAPGTSVALLNPIVGEDVGGEEGLSISHTIVRSGTGLSLVQTVVAEKLGSPSSASSMVSFSDLDRAAERAIAKLGGGGGDLSLACDAADWMPVALVRYVDVGRSESGSENTAAPVVPCASLWDAASGERLASVVVYQSVFEEEGRGEDGGGGEDDEDC
ncbi:hypothetical protein B0T22DRAFT_52532 [Podospora appendiculata]|uniref:Diphthine--ammonia ligase n=1 Tax=Podospora appendiculata TaxID=314037 RepID=A0AAE1CGK1_9PEZI|nr:hypothetical protein B0T22DRAFT_52532 [Podospora appendiculata]